MSEVQCATFWLGVFQTLVEAFQVLSLPSQRRLAGSLLLPDPRRHQPAGLLELEAYGAKQIPIALLESDAGKYGGGKIVVSLEPGQLFFLGASGVKRKLYALADDTFLIEDTSVPPESQARVRFVKNAAGDVTELQLMVADGRAFPRAREPK